MTLLHCHDLQKHFDTLGHTISFDKMKCIDFSDKAVEWFPCYLTSRYFFISIYNIFSDTGNTKCGVTQESKLEFLLFFVIFIDKLFSLALPYLSILTYMMTMQVAFSNIKILQKSKTFWINNLWMYAIGLLKISYEVIFDKGKTRCFLSVEKEITRD